MAKFFRFPIFVFRFAVTIVMFAIVLPSTHADAARVAGPQSKLEFTSGDRRIQVDRYAPSPQRNRHQNILVLHGAGGMLFDGARMRRVARALSENGYTVFVLHYFNRTANIYVRDPAMMKNFETWRGTVRDGISWVAEQRQPDSHTSKIGVYGYSLAVSSLWPRHPIIHRSAQSSNSQGEFGITRPTGSDISRRSSLFTENKMAASPWRNTVYLCSTS